MSVVAAYVIKSGKSSEEADKTDRTYLLALGFLFLPLTFFAKKLSVGLHLSNPLPQNRQHETVLRSHSKSGQHAPWNFMKNSFYFSAGTIFFGIIADFCCAQTTQNSTGIPAPTPYSVVQRDANSRVWGWTEYQQAPDGEAIPKTHQYTELASGLCYQQDGQWMDSQEQITILPDGSAEATQGQHQAYFPADIYNGVIKLVTPDGLQLQSQPMALSYYDGTNTVIIAVLTNSVGELIASNQIIYPNAFEGVDADLLYSYKKSGFEQDVIFRSQPSGPGQFGLNPAYTRLQMLTEFLNPPTPVQSPAPGSFQDGLQDTTLTFGQMMMGHGRAFMAGASGLQNNRNEIPVCKSWVNSDGRTLLVEEVPYLTLYPELATLPSQPLSTMNSANPILHKVSSRRLLPPVRLATVTTNAILLARADSAQKPGFVFDYVTVNSNETNFTFQGDVTYYISSPFYLFGTTTVEGGAIIKMTNYSTGGGMINIDQHGTVNCQTAPYRPAVFTSMDDNTLGETVAHSTGSPGIEENNYYLMINSNSLSIHDCRFSYALLALCEGTYPATINITNCQFENTEVAVYAHDVGLYNVLIGTSTNVHSQIMSDQDAQVYIEGTNLVAENVTADSGYTFIEADNINEVMALTNCLITGESMTNQVYGSTILTNGVVYLPSPSVPVYQAVGGGNYYLTNSSPYRDYGTANIDSQLLGDLAKKTTYPPIVYDLTNISSLGTLINAALRDTNTFPDIGYHYDPLDYVFGGCDLYSNLTVTAGTGIGWFEDFGSRYPSLIDNCYGMSLNNGANLSFNGTAIQPCYLAQFRRVQEGGNNNWTNVGWNLGFIYSGISTTPEPQITANFLIASASYGVNTIQDRGHDGSGTFKNCEFYDSGFTSYNEQSLDFTNCLFFRMPIAFWDSGYDLSFVFENCTFYNGGLLMDRSGLNPSFWQIQNSSFDDTAINWSDVYSGASTNTLFDYNAYNTNNTAWRAYAAVGTPLTNKLENVGPTDVMVTNYNWESSWFGNFYVPANSPVVNAGSTTADQLGLYHFTTQTNQIPETNSIVDIGYHYVATDQFGNPLDSNGDGIADYLEDPAGNGSGNWNTTLLLNVIITQPQSGSVLP